MRLAGETPKQDPEVFQTIWKHLKTDGMPDQAANHLTAEMLTHGEDLDSSIEKYERYYDIYREKGFNEHAAQAMAVEALEGKDEAPRESTRFAMLHEQPEQSEFTVPEGTSGEDIAAISTILNGKKPESVYIEGRKVA